MTSPHKEKDGDTIMRDVSQPINTYGLTDNCYYVTAARLLNVTTDALVVSSEHMQLGGGATIAQAREFFGDVGLPTTVTERATLQGVEEAIRALGAAEVTDYALAFRRTDGSGHVIIARFTPGPISIVRYYDYQLDSQGAPAGLDIAGAVGYYLFH